MNINLCGQNLIHQLINTVLKYLKSRGVSEDDMIKYSIGYCEDGLYLNKLLFLPMMMKVN